jgi:hypothetical protein
MKKTKRPNPHIGRDALADVRARAERDPRLRARIDAAVARATIAVMVKRARLVSPKHSSRPVPERRKR